MTPRPNAKDDALRRLKIIEGHFKKIIKMIEADEYCIDIIHQTSAVRSAVKKAEEVLLKNHLNNCVVKAIKSNGEEKAVNELMTVFKSI